MDTQGEKNRGYPANAKRKSKKKHGRGKLKDKAKQTNIQNNQKNSAALKQDPIQQPPWVSNAAGAIATRFATSLLGKRTNRRRRYTRETSREKFKFSGLGCMSPESCSKVLSATKLRSNAY